jgi:hypothetical protein
LDLANDGPAQLQLRRPRPHGSHRSAL